MTITITEQLKARAVKLFSYSIPSPTKRKGSSNNLLNTTVYFDKRKGGKGKDKDQPHKDATLYVSDENDAAELGATHDGVETLDLYGTKYRWLKSEIKKSDTGVKGERNPDLAEIWLAKGMGKGNRIIGTMMVALCKALTSAYIKALPLDVRKMITDKVSNMLEAACAEVLNTGDKDEKKSDFF